MGSIESMVSATLEKNGHSELRETWLKICALYGEGGPELLDSTYSEKIKEIRSKFTKELRQIQSEKPMVKSQKKEALAELLLEICKEKQIIIATQDEELASLLSKSSLVEIVSFPSWSVNGPATAQPMAQMRR